MRRGKAAALLAVSVVLAQLVVGCSTARDETIRIPFEFYRGKFRFPAEVNGAPCSFTLDNGILWEEVLLFGSPRIDAMGLDLTDQVSLGAATADVDTSVTVRLGDLVFRDQTAIVSRYDPERPNPWEGFDGQLSGALFNRYVVRIDFDNAVIELTPPGAFSYEGEGQAFAMKEGPWNTRTIEAEVVLADGATATLDLIVDLGGLHPLYLPIGRHDAITLPENAVEANLGSGLFVQQGHLGRIKSLRLGRYVLSDVPTAFQEVAPGADAFGNTMIGLPLLRRFNPIFDYSRETLILEPSRRLDEPFPQE